MNHNITLPRPRVLDIFDKHEGCKRTEKKVYDRTIMYKGFEIKRNTNVPQGAEGYWEVPKLKWRGVGESSTGNVIDENGNKFGFLTVSITQAKEAIDKYMEYNV